MPRKLMVQDNKEEGVEEAPAQVPQERVVYVPTEMVVLQELDLLKQEIIALRNLTLTGFQKCGVDFSSQSVPQSS